MAIVSWVARFLIEQNPLVKGFRVGTSVMLAIAVTLFVLQALGLYGIGKTERARGLFLSWVPGIQLYILGACADVSRGRHVYAILLPALMVGTVLTMAFVRLTAWLAGIAICLIIVLAVFYFIALYRVFRQFSKGAVAMLVISIVLFFMGPVFLFALRHRNPIRY